MATSIHRVRTVIPIVATFFAASISSDRMAYWLNCDKHYRSGDTGSGLATFCRSVRFHEQRGDLNGGRTAVSFVLHVAKEKQLTSVR